MIDETNTKALKFTEVINVIEGNAGNCSPSFLETTSFVKYCVLKFSINLSMLPD